MADLDKMFEDYVPEVSDKEVADALRFAKPKVGVYMAKSLGNGRSISKATKAKPTGKVMCTEQFVLLRPSDQAVSAVEVNKWHILPIPPRAVWLASEGYEGYDEATGTVIEGSQIANLLANFDADGGKNKMWLNRWRSRLRAGFGREAFPGYPVAVEGSNYTQFTTSAGEVVDKATAEAIKGELVKAIKLAAHSALKDKGFFKNQIVYIDLYYEKKKVFDENGDPVIDPATGKQKEVEGDFPAFDWFYGLDSPPKDKEGNVKEVLDPFTSVK